MLNKRSRNSSFYILCHNVWVGSELIMKTCWFLCHAPNCFFLKCDSKPRMEYVYFKSLFFSLLAFQANLHNGDVAELIIKFL